jgi:SAM-dependent methyltransferase
MNLPHNGTLLDIGCGTGTTALLVSREFDYRVTAVDASAANIERAAGRADSTSVSFELADAHTLPFEDCEFDGILAECVLSLLADKPVALTELRRVLKPGGRVGLTDMSVGGALPDDLVDVAAPWTCLRNAIDVDDYRTMFTDAGFSVTELADESAGLMHLMKSIKRKLLLAGAGGLLPGGVALDLVTIRYWLDRFATEVAKGNICYLRFQLHA